MALDVLFVGGTYRFKLTAYNNGVIWNLSVATVTLYLRKPSGALLTKTATIDAPLLGNAYYDTIITDLDEVEVWSAAWKVTDGAVVQRSNTAYFLVREETPL